MREEGSEKVGRELEQRRRKERERRKGGKLLKVEEEGRELEIEEKEES